MQTQLNLSRTGAARVAGAAGLAALLALAACSADKPKPTPLEPISTAAQWTPRWTAQVGAVTFPLAIAHRAGRFIVATDDGSVAAFDAATGTLAWRTSVGARITAGVGADDRRVAVVTADHQLVLVEQGEVRWRTPLPSGSTTPPLVAGDRVFVLGVDRAVSAFDGERGQPLWRVKRPGEALTLGHGGVLTAVGNTLVAGQGARMSGFDPADGRLQWETVLASPRGTNEVERIADLVGPAGRQGSVLCARAFQAAVGCVDAADGKLAWSRPVGGVRTVAVGPQVVVGADGSGRMTAWKLAGGDVAWRSERFTFREPGGMAVLGDRIVFGDIEGVVHGLQASDGTSVRRLVTDGKPIVSAPTVGDGVAVLVTRGGSLVALGDG